MKIGFIRDALVGAGGKLWTSFRAAALWPYPPVVFNVHASRLTWDDYRRFAAVIRPGDVFLSKSEPYFLSNAAIAGTFFKHAGVYVGAVRGDRDKKTHFIRPIESMGVDYEFTANPPSGVFARCVAHAIGEGVVCQDFGEAFFHADWFAVVRPHTTTGQQTSIVKTALAQVGKKYDFGFNQHEHKRFYCTELAAYSIQAAGIAPPKTSEIVNNPLGFIFPAKCFKAQAYLADSFLSYPVACVSQSVEDSKVLEDGK